VENNPVNANDPEGQVANFVIGGLIGGGTTLAAELVMKGFDLRKVSFTKVALGTLAGVATSGASAFAQTAVNAGRISAATATAVDFGVAGAIDVASGATFRALNEQDAFTTRDVLVDLGFSGLGSFGGNLVGNAVRNSGASQAASREINRLMRIADSRVADNLPRPARAQARYDQAAGLSETLANKELVGSAGTSSTISTVGAGITDVLYPSSTQNAPGSSAYCIKGPC
jgi:hypothetical protein